jgi:hypothetical protein
MIIALAIPIHRQKLENKTRVGYRGLTQAAFQERPR